MTARFVTEQATSSSAGKSTIDKALRRLFAEDGFTVAPRRVQNMALNSSGAVRARLNARQLREIAGIG